MKSGYLLSTSLVLIDEQKKYNVTFCVTLAIYQSRFCSLERYSDRCLIRTLIHIQSLCGGSFKRSDGRQSDFKKQYVDKSSML